jgi:hypothetical protein
MPGHLVILGLQRISQPALAACEIVRGAHGDRDGRSDLTTAAM